MGGKGSLIPQQKATMGRITSVCDPDETIDLSDFSYREFLAFFFEHPVLDCRFDVANPLRVIEHQNIESIFGTLCRILDLDHKGFQWSAITGWVISITRPCKYGRRNNSTGTVVTPPPGTTTAGPAADPCAPTPLGICGAIRVGLESSETPAFL